MVADSVQRAPRLSITNLQTGTTLTAQFNPTSLRESIEAKWNNQTPLGLSHEVLHFGNTGNEQFPLELFFRALTPLEMEAIHRARRFLKSLCYPVGGAETVAGGAPPRVLVVWPRMITMQCIIRSVGFEHALFNIQGRSRQYVATVQCEEIRDFRITSEEVFEDNQLRFGGVPGIDVEEG